MRARWRQILEASKDEALLGVNLYNQPSQPRRIEGFYVHMHLAWLYMLHAKFLRDGIDFRYRQPNGRFTRVDGEPKTWELNRCLEEEWPHDHPVRHNLEVSIRIRNKIEHRFATVETVAQYTAGYAQALLLNFEDFLVSNFGPDMSLAEQLRFPIFLSSITPTGIGTATKRQSSVASEVAGWLANYESGLAPGVLTDQRYEFRVHLIPQLGSKTDADLSLSFIREDDLTPDQREALETLGKSGKVIVRQQLRPVANLGKLKPAAAAAEIEARIPFKFSVYGPFSDAWKALAARPPSGDPNPERTKEQYCVWDDPHGDYLYTQAFVDQVVRRCQTTEGFRELIGRDPTPKPASVTRIEAKHSQQKRNDTPGAASA